MSFGFSAFTHDEKNWAPPKDAVWYTQNTPHNGKRLSAHVLVAGFGFDGEAVEKLSHHLTGYIKKNGVLEEILSTPEYSDRLLKIRREQLSTWVEAVPCARLRCEQVPRAFRDAAAKAVWCLSMKIVRDELYRDNSAQCLCRSAHPHNRQVSPSPLDGEVK